MMNRDLDIPAFTLAECCEVCSRLHLDTLRSWFGRGIIRLGKRDAAAAAGGTRKLTIRRMLQISVMSDLVMQLRVGPERAAALAFSFSDLPSVDGDHTRKAGRLFGRGAHTMLFFQPHMNVDQVLRVDDETLIVKVVGQGGDIPLCFLPLDPIVERVELFVCNCVFA